MKKAEKKPSEIRQSEKQPSLTIEELPELIFHALSDLLTVDEKKAVKGFYVLGDEKLPEHRIKCLTPLLILYENYRDRMDHAHQKKIDSLLHLEIESAEMHQSPSGRFQIYYFRDGNDAVPSEDTNQSGIPDYVERAAVFADESWEKQVAILGYEDPAADEPLSIRIRNTGSRVYGYTEIDGETTRIVVHNNFQNFPPNDDPDGHQSGALKVTIAHELKHSIQFVTSRWRGDSGSFDWIEMDATMMENVVYPQVNDYYNYITGTSGIFRNPRLSTPVAYAHVTWSLYFAEYLGNEFWVDTWRVIREDPLIPVVSAMKQANSAVYDQREQFFNENMLRNHLWHATSGSRTIEGYGFAESEFYPDAFMEEHHQPVPDLYSDSGNLETLSGTYRMFYPRAGQIGPISIEMEHSHDQFAVGVLGYRSDGTVAEWLITADHGGRSVVESPFLAADLDSFLVAIVNCGTESAVSYTLALEIFSVPDVATLEPNFPNPFSTSSGQPGTTFAFSVPESERVTLDVYDITGRKVARLFDQEVQPGRYLVPFSAENMASGVYIYYMHAGDVQKVRKMTLFR